MISAHPAAVRHVVRAVAVMMCTLTLLVAGCAPADRGVIAAAVEDVYADAQGLSPDQRESQRAHDEAVLNWAAELGIAKPWTAQELRREYGALSGEETFGVTDMTFWDFYTERISQTEDLLKAHIRDSLSLPEVRTYFDEHIDQFARQDTLTVKVVPWQDGRAGDAYMLTIDEQSVRVLQEQDDELVAAALDLQAGDEAVVELPDGSYLQVTCESRTDAGYQPFGDVTQAALSQLTTERFNAEVQRRIDASANG